MTDGWKDPSRFGWAWVIVAVIVVGLVAYWAGVTLHDDPGSPADRSDVTEPMTEGGEARDGQRAAGQIQGEAGDLGGPRQGLQAYGQDIQPAGLKQYVDWVQSQPIEANLDDEQIEAYVSRGTTLLQSGVDGVLTQGEQLSAALEADSPSDDRRAARGGGPPGLDITALESYRREATESLERVSEAGGPLERAEAFQRAATDTAALASEIEAQANIGSLRSPVEDMQRIARELRPDQPLGAQSDDVRLFFDQAAYVLARISQSFEATMPAQRSR